jgi:hypothetical protein
VRRLSILQATVGTDRGRYLVIYRPCYCPCRSAPGWLAVYQAVKDSAAYMGSRFDALIHDLHLVSLHNERPPLRFLCILGNILCFLSW